MNERLVLCGGARREATGPALRLALGGAEQNIKLRLEDISRAMVRPIPDRIADLTEIAAYVYCADQGTSRGGPADVGMGARWRRRFRFVIPVRDPDHWSGRAVVELLHSTLSFLSDDEYEFEFEQASSPPPFQDYLAFGEDDPAAFGTDRVVLFSGGLDSLSGAIEELSAKRTRIALVSHRSSPKVHDHQKRLVRALKHRFPKRILHVPILLTRQRGLPVREFTQRTRSFLYSALGCAVGHLLGNNSVRFYENGVVSINLPISEQVVGARATRTTHPLVLDLFRRFFSAALGASIFLDNPFIWRTKSEVVRAIVVSGCGDLIRETVSCTRVHEATKLHTHCGCCSQCLDRRFGVLAAAAGEHDPVEMYRIELLTGDRDKPLDRVMA
ncbi:MAG: hypothetical protein H0T75_12405, partial [Rhizobiales bacterium]|nr:hypothetical protein [Hyphomicrobiales bacterium]